MTAVPLVVLNTAAELDQAVAAARPLVIKGLLERWPALAAGRESPKALNRYLKSLDRGLPGIVMEAPASAEGRFGYSRDMREFTFSKRKQGISETLDRIERQIGRPNTSTVAVQMLPLAAHLPDFIAQNSMPLLPHTAPLLWLGGRCARKSITDPDGQPKNSPFPKSLASWHRHTDICVFPDRSVKSNLRDEQCKAGGGRFTALTQWMVHAWIWKDSPTGVFSPTNPTVL